MAFAENAAGGIHDRNSKHSAVFELQSKRGPEPFRRITARIEIDRAFDAKKARYRHSGTLRHALISANAIADRPDGLAVLH